MKRFDWVLIIAVLFCLAMALTGCGTVASIAGYTDEAIMAGKRAADADARAKAAINCSMTAGAALRLYRQPDDWAAYRHLCQRGE